MKGELCQCNDESPNWIGTSKSIRHSIATYYKDAKNIKHC